MNIQLEKDVFYPILSQVQGILEKRSAALPVFRNILISAKKNSARICASDSELSFVADIPCEVLEKGDIVVNGKKIFEIIREFSSQALSLETDESHNIKITQNQAVFSIPGLLAEDFPAFPPLKNESPQKISALSFLSIIEKTIYCVSLDESRYHLTGVFFAPAPSSGWRFAATDGHRLSFIDIEGGEVEGLGKGVIIPRKGLYEIKKMLSGASAGDSLEIYIEPPRLSVQFKNQNLNIRLVEGDYPDYQNLLPTKKGSKAVLLRKDFLSSLKRIATLTSERFKGVDFSFDKDKLRIHFSHPEVGEASEEISCKYKGRPASARFNFRYIQDILQAINNEKLDFFIKDSGSAGIIHPQEEENYTALVMPMVKKDDEEGEDAPENGAPSHLTLSSSTESENPETDNK